MSEKGDLPSDQVSLPPNYAPSETFTESPPPAYKRSGTVTVRVAKIVCLTALAITFLIGFFVVSHKWVQSKECNCSLNPETFERPAALVAQAGGILYPDLDGNLISDERKDIEHTNDGNSEGNLGGKDEEIIIPDQNIEIVEESETNEAEAPLNENDIIEEMTKQIQKIKLPIDILMGNPELAGRDLECNVETRRKKIGEGVFTEAIIVICDNDEEPEAANMTPLSTKPFHPPMSLLGNIMKILASRPRNQSQRPPMQRVKLFPMEPPRGPMHMRGPVPFPIIRPNNGPIHGPFSPHMLPLMPMNRFQGHRPHRIPEIREIPMHKMMHMLHFPGDMTPMRIIKKIIVHPIPAMHDPMETSDTEPGLSPVSIINAPPRPLAELNPFPLPINQVKIIRIPKQNHFQQNHFLQNEYHQENEQNHHNMIPFPFHPIMKMFPARRAKVLRLMPAPIAGNRFHDRNHHHDEDFPRFDGPVHRGAFPLHHEHHNPHEYFNEEVPEASGRSLPSPPVAVPGPRFIRLPGRSEMFPFPEARVMTHMEFQQAPEGEDQVLQGQDSETAENKFSHPVFPFNEEAEGEQEEFGPPRTHTVIESAPEPIFRDDAPMLHFHPQHQESLEKHQFHEQPMEEEHFQHSPFEHNPFQGAPFQGAPFQGAPFQEEPITQPQFQNRFFAPPPPRFSREGRFSPFAVVNPDAERLTEQIEEHPSPFHQQNNHHIILN